MAFSTSNRDGVGPKTRLMKDSFALSPCLPPTYSHLHTPPWHKRLAQSRLKGAVKLPEARNLELDDDDDGRVGRLLEVVVVVRLGVEGAAPTAAVTVLIMAPPPISFFRFSFSQSTQ